MTTDRAALGSLGIIGVVLRVFEREAIEFAYPTRKLWIGPVLPKLL